MSDVVVVRTGLANVASVLAALRRLGVDGELSDDAGRVREAARVVFPGVGSFGAVAAVLDETGLRDALRERVEQRLPTLGICLGMQVLFESSDESPGAVGVGVAAGTVGRFVGDMTVPQMGWNRVEADAACTILRSGFGYFANSYRVESLPAGWAGAVSEYGGEFVAGVERGSVVACQFHPELSGAYGRGIFERWLAASEQPASTDGGVVA